MRTLTAVARYLWRVSCGIIVLTEYSMAAEPRACGEPGSNWVRLTVDAAENHQIARKLLERLQAELTPHAISVCTGEGNVRSAPLADVNIVHSTSNWVGIEVQVDDAVTQKRVARKLDLSGLPPDTHALTIAIGAAELLRASWAEINLRRTNEPHRDVPLSVRSTVDEAMPDSTSRVSFGFRVATEEFARGLRQAGADANGRFLVHGPWSVVFRLGARQAFSTKSDDGTIRANSWLLGTGSLVRLTPPKAKASVELVGRLDYTRLQFYAEPLPGASAIARAGSGCLGSAGVLGTFKLSNSSQIEAEFDAGGVIQGVSARDGGRTVVAMNGPWVGASLGLGVRAW